MPLIIVVLPTPGPPVITTTLDLSASRFPILFHWSRDSFSLAKVGCSCIVRPNPRPAIVAQSESFAR
jgi:hypothetical protein